MPKKPSPNESFRSIQILSAKAQSLWAKAKERMQKNEASRERLDLTPPNTPRQQGSFMNIRVWTIVKVVIVVLLIQLGAKTLLILKDKIFILLMAMFIALVVDPHVRRLERMRLPRPIAILVLYATVSAIAVLLFASLIPIVASQMQEIAQFINQSADAFLQNPSVNIPFMSENFNEQLSRTLTNILQRMELTDRSSILVQFGENFSGVMQYVVEVAVGVAGSLGRFFVSTILVLLLAFFIQMERENIADFIRVLLPRDFREYFDTKSNAVHQKVSQWFQGQLILCLVIAVLAFIALTVLGMPYALTLALLAGFMEFIPYAGPIISGCFAVLIALSQSGPGLALVVLCVYYAIQLCENNLLVPLVMKHAVGLSPIAIVFGMLVGVSFPTVVHPVMGIILAVPTTAVITIFVRDFYAYRRKK